MSVFDDRLESSDNELVRLVSIRNIFNEQWEKEFLAAGGPLPWEHLPTIDTTTGQIWNHIPSVNGGYTDRYCAFIVGTNEGKRYVRTVEVTWSDRANGRAACALLSTLNAVQRLGPSVCTVVEEGGLLPLAEDQVAWDAV